MNALAKHCRGFVLGFSTGHVGTTTLSTRTMYRAPANVSSTSDLVQFFFELVARPPPGELSISAQRAFSFEVWLPSVLRRLRRIAAQPVLCVDLGHTWLPIHRALPDLLREAGIRVQLVRIRRNAHEVARSIGYDMTGGHEFGPERLHACGESLRLVFCPKRMRDGGILCVNATLNRHWEVWSPYQKGLWIADETEAQWQRYHVATDDVLEVAWSDDRRYGVRELLTSWSDHQNAVAPSTLNSSPILLALVPLAKYLGLSTAETTPRTKQHVPRDSRAVAPNVSFNLSALWKKQLERYGEQMKGCDAFRELHLPSHYARVHA